MDERLKHRLVGAAVLVLAAVVFVPMLLNEGEKSVQPTSRLVPAQPLEETGARVVPLGEMPATPEPTAAAATPAPVEDKADKAQMPNKPVEPRAAPPSPPPAVGSGFAVQLASFSKAANAEGLRDKLTAKGYKAYVKSAGAITRVYVGPQPSREEAERVLNKLLADTKLKGIVVEHSG